METSLSELEREYRETVARKWSVLRVGDAQIPLQDVFAMLETTERSRHTPGKAPELPPLPERFEHAGMTDFPATGVIPKRMFLSEALRESRHIILLGEPGAGKSTTLQFVGLCFAKQGWARERLELEEDRLPILLDLKLCSHLLSRAGPGLEEALGKEVAQLLRDEGEAGELVRKLKDEGRLLLLLDGLDEVPEGEYPAVRKEIADFASSPVGRSCRILVASRLVGYVSLGGEFKEFTLKPFQDPEETLPYLRGWLAALRPEWKEEAEDRAEAVLSEIKRHPPLRRVLDNPLLLRLIAEVYAATGQVAHNRAEIYEQWVEEIWKRAVRRGAQREKKDCALKRLEEIAWRMHNGLQVEINEEDNELLREKMGLLVRVDRRQVVFSHQTVREYFVARRLKRAWKENRLGTWKFLRPRLHIPEWREPLFLLAGVLVPEDAGDLIRRVESAKSLYEKYLGRDLLLALRLWGEAVEVHPDIGPSLIRKALGHREAGVRAAAAWALGEIKAPEAVRYLFQALEDEEVYVRMAAAGALGEIGPEALPHLIQALKDEEGDVREAATWALGEIKAPEAVPHLIQALKDEDEDVRWAAAGSLGEIKAPEAIPHLIQALGDEDKNVRWLVAEALGKTKAPEAIPHLIQALEDEDKDVRAAAAMALGEIKALEAVLRLIDALEAKNGVVRWAAAEALGKIGSPDSLPNLLEALKDKDGVVRWAAARALGEIGPEAVRHLIEGLRDEDEDVRRAAAETLWEIKAPEAVPHLIEALEDQDEDVRWLVAEALGEIKAPEAIPHLIQALGDEDKDVRAAAAMALGECVANLYSPKEPCERKKLAALLHKAKNALWKAHHRLLIFKSVNVREPLIAVLAKFASLEPPPYFDPLSPEAISGWRGKWEKIKPFLEPIAPLAALASLAYSILKGPWWATLGLFLLSGFALVLWLHHRRK